MSFSDERQTTQIIGDYIEKENSGYRNIAEKELSIGGIAPEARVAFNRKPYYSTTNINFKTRPVLRQNCC